ncbi:M14 family metallopeptidase [Thalassotalea euphylliae]|uniref:Zinc carboxypeptidase n=1 Tax=Thalassotalea euphylliae TaxID=1655234 RepID=A0A3E0UFS5_9GAMM|nr:M14 family metallopeptidase [Thalassotalea euphylliae]REL35716.1 zinc carboxypeptidase [Thalassotalea euphylliae]
MYKFVTSTVLSLFAASSFACQSDNIQLLNNFSNATSASLMQNCEIDESNNQINVKLLPENKPINNSPWYAFQLVSKEPRTVTLTLTVNDGDHRYLPKVSRDGKNWQQVDYKIVEDKMHVELAIDTKTTWIAGQELITNKDYIDWGKKLSEFEFIDHNVIGRSVNGKPIYQVITNQPSVKQWLVVLGRQHPPEVTGAIALFPFVDTLLGNSELARYFRQNYNIVVVPNMNPDGVELGYWRHNANGVDLNRDWNKFKQPEVIAVDKLLTDLVAKGHKISMAVDFHSTHKDIFYTMPNDYGVQQRYLVNNWLNKLDKQYPEFNVIQKPGNNPQMGVFKQYVADKFDVHAITYEMGDNTDRKFIHKLAKDAANTLMQTMLKDNDQLR